MITTFLPYLYLIIFLLSVSLAVFIAFLIILSRKKEKGFLSQGMRSALFLVTLPQFTKKEGEKDKSVEEQLKIAEQFYAALSGIKESNKIKRFLFGNPSLIFEIAVPRVGEEIHFYIAAPRSIAQTVEKQILGFWPKAQIQPALDYNIFNPSGKTAGSISVLSKSSFYPLRPHQELTTDPLSTITSVFTKLAREGEGAALQIIIRKSQQSLKEDANKKINSLLGIEKEKESSFITDMFFPKQEEKPSAPKPRVEPTPVEQAQIAAISQKSKEPLFDVNIRILTSAPTEERSIEILRQIQSSFDQFNSPTLNQIKFRKLSGKKLTRLYYRFSFRIFSEKEIILLSSGELASIFHFPSSSLITPSIKWLKTRQASPPPNLPNNGTIIGKNIFRGEERIVSILQDDRRRHFYIIGQTGTGKSVLLQEMIRQDIESGGGVALIDPHGDIAEKVLELIPQTRIKDVIYFNPSDFEKPLGLNMLEYDLKYPEAKTFVVNELLEIFEKLYNLKTHGFGGPIFEQYMRNALLLVMEDPDSGNTLIEIPRVLADVNFRKYKLSKCQNMVVKNFWELEAEKAGGEASLANMVPYITSKMNVFIANDLMRPIIAQQQSSFNFREIMDQQKILIINLSKGKLGDINSYLLGMIIVGKILLAAFSRADIPEDQRRDFNLYIDEFHNVTTTTITAALAEARKYHLSLTFGHQFIGQLDEDTRKAIFGNVGSMLAFRVGSEDAKYLITGFEPVFDENDLVNLDNYNAALRLLIKGATTTPFNIVTMPPKKGDEEIARLVKEYSRIQYGKDRFIIESELRDRLSKNY